MISFLHRNIGLNKGLITLIFLLSLSVNFSCKNALDIAPTRLSSETTEWKRLEDAKGGIIGLYALMRTAMVADNTHWLMGDLRRGDFVSTDRADLKAIIDGQLNASYPIINSITNWRRFYSVVNAASLFIERSGEILALDPRYTAITHDADVAQARTLRAFAYFYMVRIWGDVPLLTSSHDGDFTQHARTSQDKVLAFATAELLAAAKILPYTFGGTDPQLPGLYYGISVTSWNGVLLSKISAYAILAHIAAWQGNYVDTEVYTKFIMDNYTKINTYGPGSFGIRYIDMQSLTENYNPYSPFAFKRATQIVGFGFEYGNGEATANGHLEQLTLAAPIILRSTPDIYVPKDSIRKIFTDPKDLRFSIDTATKLYRTNYFVNYSSDMPVFDKIKVIADANTSGNFALFTSAVLFTRLEELTLLRAEALAVLGQRNEAIDNLNRATDLRGVAPYSALSSVDLVDAIFAERRRELMGEGWRWYDQVRYNRIKRNNAAFSLLLQRNGIYWPISTDVLNANSLITQNNYWK